jgi:hypothetical protein
VAYVRKKKVGKYEYYQLVEGYRENGKVRQRVLAHLGRDSTVEGAAARWERQAAYCRSRAKDLEWSAPLLRVDYPDRKVFRVGAGGKWFLPKAGTQPDPSYQPGGFAPPGWFYYPPKSESPTKAADEMEKAAQDCLREAEKFEAKAEFVRGVVTKGHDGDRTIV